MSMLHHAKVVADSLSPDMVRLTTFEVIFPRCILAEVNTHKMLSKNSASSRAIPTARMIELVTDTPYMPRRWGKNQPGMQAYEELHGEALLESKLAWLRARDAAVEHAQRLTELENHKQTVNRLLEPWMWHTAIISGTEWANFFHLRCHPAAQPDFQLAAELMRKAMSSSDPQELQTGQWHLPYVHDEDFEVYDSYPEQVNWDAAVKLATGRCAAVSYMRHDRIARNRSIELAGDLKVAGHMSPLEHPGRPATKADVELPSCRVHINDVRDGGTPHAWVAPYNQWHGNYRGWVQYRKTIPNEEDPLRPT